MAIALSVSTSTHGRSFGYYRYYCIERPEITNIIILLNTSISLIGNRLLEICVEQLLMEDMWNLNSQHVNTLMSQAIDTADSWMQLCDSLTRLFWPNYVQHPWVGEPHMPKRGQQFKERLSEIKNIKSLYKQIATLLDDEEMKIMLYESSPFKGIK